MQLLAMKSRLRPGARHFWHMVHLTVKLVTPNLLMDLNVAKLRKTPKGMRHRGNAMFCTEHISY